MIRNGIRFNTIGDVARLPQRLLRCIEETKRATSHCKDIELVLALNYGGRDDIRRATCAIIEDCQNGKIRKEDVTEQLLSLVRMWLHR